MILAPGKVFVIAVLAAQSAWAEPSPVPSPATADSAGRPGFDDERLVYLIPIGEKKIGGLKWNPVAEEITATWKGEVPIVRIVASGTFEKPEWTLIFPARPDRSLEVGADGKVRFEWTMEKQAQRIEVQAISPEGEIESQELNLFYPAFGRVKEKVEQAPERRFGYQLGLGTTWLAYRQTRYEPYSMFALTGKGAAFFKILPPILEGAFTLFANLLPLARSRRDTSIRFIGANLRAGIGLPVPEPWRFSVLAGLQYSHMIVSGSRIGYRHLLFPQVVPTLHRAFGVSKLASVYLKYVPIGKKLSLFNPSELELAVGGGFAWTLESGRALLVTLDAQRTKFTMGTSSVVSYSTISTGLALGI